MAEVRLYGTTSAGGALSVEGEAAVCGELVAVVWIDGTFDNNVTAVISTIDHEGASTLLTIGAGEGDNDEIFYPREIVHDMAADVLTGTAGGDRVKPLAVGTPKLVVAAGGNAKSGGCILYIKDL